MRNMTLSTDINEAATRAEQHLADEQLKQAILNKKQAQIDAWSLQIDRLRQSLDSAADTVRAVTEQRLADLEQARDQGLDQLEGLRQATRETWGSLLRQSDDLFQDLASRFHDLATKTKQS